MDTPKPPRLAALEPRSRLDQVLARVPGLLSSRVHQLVLVVLGAWLIVVPLIPWLHWLAPSASAELIGGNWTNVSSALGACIAAGASISAHHKARKTHDLIADLHQHHLGERTADHEGTPQ